MTDLINLVPSILLAVMLLLTLVLLPLLHDDRPRRNEERHKQPDE